MMFQSFALFPHLSVLDNVAFSLQVKGVPRRSAMPGARILLERVALVPFGQPQTCRTLRRPAAARGAGPGPHHRAACAAARRAARPPSTPSCASGCVPKLRRWQTELGFTFIHVTHSQEEAMALSDIMVVMNHGVIEQVGSPHEVFNRRRASLWRASWAGTT